MGGKWEVLLKKQEKAGKRKEETVEGVGGQVIPVKEAGSSHGGLPQGGLPGRGWRGQVCATDTLPWALEHRMDQGE